MEIPSLFLLNVFRSVLTGAMLMSDESCTVSSDICPSICNDPDPVEIRLAFSKSPIVKTNTCCALSKNITSSNIFTQELSEILEASAKYSDTKQ
jgi:hypothetical protein